MVGDNPEEKVKLVKLRFIGGRDKGGIRRGPYLSYDTGKIYSMPPEYAAVIYWELVDDDAVDEIEEMPQGFNYSDKDVIPEPSHGLTKDFNKSGPPADDDFINGMDTETLKRYIEAQGGEVDGRLGRDKLIEEAKKLQ